MKYVYNNKIILNDPVKFVSDWTNEWFKNNPTSEKHLIVRIILLLSMGTKRKCTFGMKVNNPYISYRGRSQKIKNLKYT